MVAVECDDPALKRALQTHAEILLAQGGGIAPGLVIRATGGEISIAHPDPLPHGAPLITVPDASLVRIDEAGLVRQGGDIVPALAASALTPEQRRILETQCAVFNLAGKIAKTRSSLPQFIYHDTPDLLAALTEREIPPSGKSTTPRAARAREDPLAAFLASRVLLWREPGRPERSSRVLMSLIDYFDHHSDGASYDARENPLRLAVRSARTGAADAACHVNYSAGDAHAMFMTHGFIDTSASYTRLCRFDVAVPGFGTLQAKPGRPRTDLPKGPERDAERDFPTPAVKILAPDRIEVSNLVIKRTKGRSVLRRGLAIALLHWLQKLEQAEASRIIDQLEADILEKTRAYCTNLRGLAAASGALINPRPVIDLADHQHAVIRRYIDETGPV